MYKVLVVVSIMSATLISCSRGGKDESKGKSAGEVMTEYSQTLGKAPDKAKAAVQIEEKRSASQDEIMKELDKSVNQPRDNN